MTLVVDSSMTLAWYFEDEQTPQAMDVLREIGTVGGVVPSLWFWEVANGLQMAIRRNRVDTGFRAAALRALSALPISVDGEADRHAWTATLRLADRFGLTMYDAAYLELALRMALPLATLDRPLAAAARAEAVPVRG